MIADSPREASRAPTGSARARRAGLLAGLTWNGLALIALACLLHALRRATGEIVNEPIDAWLPAIAQPLASGLIVALLVTVAVVATYNRIPPSPSMLYPALALAVAISTAAGVLLLFELESFAIPDYFSGSGGPVWSFILTWPRYLLLGLLFTAVFVHIRTAEDSEEATHQAELDRARYAQQMDEARLQVLQAQIEPHFLFNTLATVRRLYQTDPATGESMLDNLMRYLAVALPQMRVKDSTLGRETALAEAYLQIQQIRMGKRLRFEIDLPDALRDARLPPMMLLTLAENAIKHGLGPVPEGGVIEISARLDRDRLDLRVADSGQGFTRDSGGGTGLANIRARLAALYGSAAQLRISSNHPRGVTAAISVPFATEAMARAT